MTGELKDYLGIPRKLIPWFPKIDQSHCDGCKICVKACKHEVYSYEEGKGRAFVANPYYCEVYCQSCQFQCPQETISFPTKSAIKEMIQELRKTYPPK